MQTEHIAAEDKLSELESLAHRVAESDIEELRAGGAVSIRPPLIDTLSDFEALIKAAERHFRGTSERDLTLSYAAEWVLDNHYIAAQALREIRQDLPSRYYYELPQLRAGRLAGYPRIYSLARTITQFENGLVDLERIRHFIHAYQTISPLSMGELWALPIMLRLSGVELLVLALSRITRIRVDLGDYPLPENDPEAGINDDTLVANSFVSLRTLAAQDWKAFFEELSLVENLLRRDPTQLYTGMDFDTRDRYRKVVEEIAKTAQVEEQRVARAAIRLAQSDQDRRTPERADPGGEERWREDELSLDLADPDGWGSDPEEGFAGLVEESGRTDWDGFLTQRTSHVGYYLLDRGRADLELDLGYRPGSFERLQRWNRDHPTFTYLGCIGILTALILGLLVVYALGTGLQGWMAVIAGLLSLVPVVTIAVNLVNWAVTHTVKPRVLPKMDFEAGLPVECATLVAVPAILSSPEEVDSLLRQVELHALRNFDRHVLFALVTDFSDAPEANLPEDQALVEQAIQGIRGLNQKYRRGGRGPFLLLHRERTWNEAEARWIGWERKRGKLHDLNRLILGQDGQAFPYQEGSVDHLEGIRYVITLDADTILPRDSARRLVATLAHPLNRAVFGPENQVVAGYTILQPRTEINPVRSQVSLFTRIFSGDTGLDLYTLAVSDVYQDLFGEGIYIGKGIYEVATFERSLAGRVPENALLSHDLFEGIHGRVALVTDIVLIEDFPPNYLVHVRRMHRWLRGDWQLLPWLFQRVPVAEPVTEAEDRIGRPVRDGIRPAYAPTRFSLIDRWKILDNLRRSLLAPTTFLLFVTGWLVLPGNPWIWTAAGLIALAAPLLTGLISALFEILQGAPLRQRLASLVMDAVRWFLAVVFLPYEALLTLNAILTSLYRVYVSRQSLLRWTTAAQAALRFGDNLPLQLTWRHMGVALMLVVGILLLIVGFRPEVLLAAAPLLGLWAFSPVIAYWIGRPLRPKTAPLLESDRSRLRRFARRTWLFFEQFLGPEDHWLPPDHFQEAPLGIVAHRTSPTNIGLGLLTTLGAYDLGYLGPLDLAARLRSTFETLAGLERYRGHFYNWYDTRNLDVLAPRYISTVDSGNLAACLIALAQGCREIADAPVLRWESWQGFLDLLGLSEELLDTLKNRDVFEETARLRQSLEQASRLVRAAEGEPDSWPALLARLTDENGAGWSEVDRQMAAFIEVCAQAIGAEDLRRLRIVFSRAREHLVHLRREVDMLLPWFAQVENPPALFNRGDLAESLREAWSDLLASLSNRVRISDIDPQARAARSILAGLAGQLDRLDGRYPEIETARRWCQDLDRLLESTGMPTKVLAIGFAEFARQAELYVDEMDFAFLFDRQRQVFRIGFNGATGRLDNNYYDLLASEARIASLIAIAKGDVPQSHWLHLSRPFTRVDGTQTLLSWSATMFEYLMPLLLVRSYPGTLLHQSAEAAVDWQIAYGARKRVPWGISESGYYRFDANLFYQYRAFGVPGLGYKRGLGEDLVITPYASVLALPLQPAAVLENLEALDRLGAMGAYGFYEAVDFTKPRLPLGDDYQIVRSYMAHHQGMIFLSLENVLLSDRMVHRFHADPKIQSIELLLQEMIPQGAPMEQPHAEDEQGTLPSMPGVATVPWRVQLQTPHPLAHILSNGRYDVLITAGGGGFNSWKETGLTRWRPDTTLNHWGQWIYVQDLDSGAVWSAAHQPTGVRAKNRDIFFNAHMVEFRRRDGDLTLSMEITVPPEDDIEIRRITLTNHGERSRSLRVVSYAEVTLAPGDTDARHPAFNKLFIESEFIPELTALLFRRRPRSAEEEPIFLAHAVVLESELASGKKSVHFETNRLNFLGRGHTVRSPRVLRQVRKGDWSAGSTGATLDPILSLDQEVTIGPHGTVQLAFLTAAAADRSQTLSLVSRYRAWSAIGRSFGQARSHAEAELRQLGLTTEVLERIQTLFSLLLYPYSALRAGPDALAANRRGQPGLWSYGVSGDYPILLVKINQTEHISLVRELLQAHIYWRRRNQKIDLVILNTQGTGYEQELNNQVHRLVARMDSEGWMNRRGGIFLVMADRMVEGDLVLLESAARTILDGNRGSLSEQLKHTGALTRLPSRLPAFTPSQPGLPKEPTPPLARPEGLLFDNGIGGFSPDGREYQIFLEPGRWTPAPWVNVIANPEFGCLVSESGGGFSWSLNSGENRLTPWSNDPISDQPGEAIYLRDEETAEVWSPTPLPARAAAPYLVRHGAGYTIFEHHSLGLKQRLTIFVAPDAPVKILKLRLENTWERTRRVTATYFAEWVLGVFRETGQQWILPEYDSGSQALLARNPFNPEFGERVAFAAASKPLHGLTADRTEFLGRLGNRSRPSALRRIGLAGAVQPGLDPCAALQLHLDIQPGEAQEVYFLLGQGADREEALELARRFQDEDQVAAAWEGVHRLWDGLLGAVTVRTPEPAMDLLLNRWLLYQTLSCRIWGRSAFYQSSGAYGFRDQLQDVLALLLAAPGLVREHLLRAAGHQFEAGDVLHWWHPPSGRGVRTRFSDDLLWLPYVAAEYVRVTGDTDILQEKISFLQGPLLEPNEEERYSHYPSTSEAYTLFDHCRRAIEKGSTSGPHNLPLMGSGDWNDGMNRVGREGRGESVWLGWFLYTVQERFARMCAQRGDGELAAWYRQRAADLQRALETSAWDGGWYLRAFYDDGSQLGSKQNQECQIDSIAQSWAVLSGAGDPQRAAQAMRAVTERLVRPENGLILLFTPPFNKTSRDPGYIKGYLPGIRENGGQYTHAALWTVWAFAQMGEVSTAGTLFRLINPILHADTPEKTAQYRVEPYVIAADVYSVPPHTGRGGWTWYTGSSGWMYRLGLEAILGLRREGEKLIIDPCIPPDWPGYSVSYRVGNTEYEIRVENDSGAGRGVSALELDGEDLPLKGGLPLVEDGVRHSVKVKLGTAH